MILKNILKVKQQQMAKKVKSISTKLSKPCTNCFQPQYLKFNFSFINYEEDLEDKDKIQLYERIKHISTEPYLVVSNKVSYISIRLHETRVGLKPEEYDKKDIELE